MYRFFFMLMIAVFFCATIAAPNQQHPMQQQEHVAEKTHDATETEAEESVVDPDAGHHQPAHVDENRKRREVHEKPAEEQQHEPNPEHEQEMQHNVDSDGANEPHQPEEQPQAGHVVRLLRSLTDQQKNQQQQMHEAHEDAGQVRTEEEEPMYPKEEAVEE